MEKLNNFYKLALACLSLNAMAAVEVDLCDLNTKYQYQWTESVVGVYNADQSFAIKDGVDLLVNELAQPLSAAQQQQVRQLDLQLRTGLNSMIKIERISLEMRLLGSVSSLLSDRGRHPVDAKALDLLTNTTLAKLDDYFSAVNGQFNASDIGKFSDGLEQVFTHELSLILSQFDHGTSNGYDYQKLLGERQRILGKSNEALAKSLRKNIKALDGTERALTEQILALKPFQLAIIERIKL
ncbi:hypothetical protein [Pseudoalteromonas prydzensis]|uniref:hypothetical protein n=1 Tax=Pseudoalteromonas prydzensis TaxID=182141 RepID=UPI0007E4F087|nr:hypothetical protein [Pseudoalteromonas prydzensis]MBE0377190.1 hypothetical protein [Pseudoalteromonas prydzensis ACAM 620]